MPQAKVNIKNEGTGAGHPVEANGQGYYVVSNLQAGLYTLTVEVPGFKRFESSHNKLDANSTLSLDASLSVGQTSETIEVSATASRLQTESGAVQNTVTGQQVQAQELNGRNPLYMASLIPGIRSNSTLGDFNFSLTNGGYNINGARQQDTLITLDGAPATRTRANGTSIGVPNVDATPGNSGADSRLLSRIRTHCGRPDPHHHQSGTPIFTELLRILPQLRHEREHVAAQLEPDYQFRRPLSGITTSASISAAPFTSRSSSTPVRKRCSSSSARSGPVIASPIPKPRLFPPR